MNQIKLKYRYFVRNQVSKQIWDQVCRQIDSQKYRIKDQLKSDLNLNNIAGYQRWIEAS